MTSTWYLSEKTDESQILSSRVRLARNIKKYPFRQMLSKDSAEKLIRETLSAVLNERTALNSLYRSINMSEFNETEQKVFVEKHIVSPAFVKDAYPRGLLLKDDENVSIMINEEDHIRIQTIMPGDGLSDTYELASRMDDLLEESVEYAFDKEYGYLTSCPTNTGTGLRASYMIHLPALEKTGHLKGILPAIGKFGIALRGLYGEGTESLGGIYQISNQLTLGKSEIDIVASLQNVTKFVIDREKALREKLMNQHRLEVENNIHRAYGILSYSKKMTAKEAMDLLSEVRLGYQTGLLDLPKPNKRIYQIMMEIQPGHLQRMAGQELSEQGRDAMRAEYLRNVFR
ncbi:MAG: protein arginine kinase [Clostridiales bacterium]|jgi:protein arginine kinase|nr:protein arginine kinase [Clostridiales bacterium]